MAINWEKLKVEGLVMPDGRTENTARSAAEGEVRKSIHKGLEISLIPGLLYEHCIRKPAKAGILCLLHENTRHSW